MAKPSSYDCERNFTIQYHHQTFIIIIFLLKMADVMAMEEVPVVAPDAVEDLEVDSEAVLAVVPVAVSPSVVQEVDTTEAKLLAQPTSK